MAYFVSLQASTEADGNCSEQGQGQEFGEEDGKGESRNAQPKRRRQQVSSGSSDDEEEWLCLICGDNFRNSQSKEVWIQCQQCLGWAHDKCTEERPYLLCPNCESDYSD